MTKHRCDALSINKHHYNKLINYELHNTGLRRIGVKYILRPVIPTKTMRKRAMSYFSNSTQKSKTICQHMTRIVLFQSYAHQLQFITCVCILSANYFKMITNFLITWNLVVCILSKRTRIQGNTWQKRLWKKFPKRSSSMFSGQTFLAYHWPYFVIHCFHL